MQHNKNSIKVTALYARFSRNDSDNESDSIDNQRKILQKYAQDNGFNCTRFYADDGITGTTFVVYIIFRTSAGYAKNVDKMSQFSSQLLTQLG